MARYRDRSGGVMLGVYSGRYINSSSNNSYGTVELIVVMLKLLMVEGLLTKPIIFPLLFIQM